MVLAQGVFAAIGVGLMGASAFGEKPNRPSMWRLGWACVALAVTLPLIKAAF